MTRLPPTIASLLDAAAARYGVSPALARAVAWVESRGNPRAKSDAGAMGVMQLMPATAEGLGVSDPFDAPANIDAGVRFLARLLTRHAVPDALAAYNWGPGNVQREQRGEARRPARTVAYVDNVLARAKLEQMDLDGRPLEPVPSEGNSPADRPFDPPAVDALLRLSVLCPRCSQLFTCEGRVEMQEKKS